MIGTTEVLRQRNIHLSCNTIKTLGLVGIRKTTAWYDSHIQQMFPINRGKKTQRPIAVLLTDDADNRRRAGEENVEAISGVLSS
jgi:hypothetical protein